MDIAKAKEELRRAFLAYTERTPDGQLCIPIARQRPLLLMGPPGVGKTAVLAQLAAVEFLLHALGRELAALHADTALAQSLASFLSACQNAPTPVQTAQENLARRERAAQIRKDSGVLPPEEEAAERRLTACIHPLLDKAADLHALEAEKAARCAAADAAEQTALSHLENALRFVSETFGTGQELLIFCTQLPSLPGAPALLRRSALYKQLLSTVLPD